MSDTFITFGICAMDKKANSKPMKAILNRLPCYIKPVIFGDESILRHPIEEWPKCDALLAFYSKGFPLNKAIEYYNKYKPFVLNSLQEQFWLLDRRLMYDKLKSNGIVIPRNEYMSRDGFGSTPSTLEEFDDYVIVNGEKINKPFVEKPVSGEDHNIYIYYPRAVGGGTKKLFRKIGDRSSEFYPEENKVRRDGSYIYEEFMATHGTDVKVYAVGPNYAHAEARKSPVVDGRVMRDVDGKEVRYPVLLNSQEKEIAWKVTTAFQQMICGFDLLRANGVSYVCDVNGCSFVKASNKFYDDAAALISIIMYHAVKIDRSILPLDPMKDNQFIHLPGTLTSGFDSMNSVATFHNYKAHTGLTDDIEGTDGATTTSTTNLTINNSTATTTAVFTTEAATSSDEELRSVVAILRHGDRTPKQKMKMIVKSDAILSLFDKYSSNDHVELKLRSAIKLTEFLTVTKSLISRIKNSLNFDIDDSDSDNDCIYKYEQIIQVLEMGNGFKGLHRKIQLKPLVWGHKKLRLRYKHKDEIPSKHEIFSNKNNIDEKDVVIEAQLILKWGGVLTELGKKQAIELGKRFRHSMYPGEGLGFLRLHSTFRNDLKVYSSEEGRVQMTAAGFAKGFLDLEGTHLTPIVVSLVTSSKESQMMLDDTSAATSELASVKQSLHKLLDRTIDVDDEFLESLTPTGAASLREAVLRIQNPSEILKHMHVLITSLVTTLKEMYLNDATNTTNTNDKENRETMYLKYRRWDKLRREFHKKKKDRYDLSKIPDIYDCVKYDLLHSQVKTSHQYNIEVNRKTNDVLNSKHLHELYIYSKLMADIVIPQEYGISESQKLSIGQKISHSLLSKLKADFVLSSYGDGTSVSCISSELSNHLNNIDGSSSSSTPVLLKESIFSLHQMFSKEKGIKTPLRRVRTRLYFTSESHIHSIMAVLRYQMMSEAGIKGIIDPSMKSILEASPEHDYLTHIVFKMYENLKVAIDSEFRFRVELWYSPGASLASTDLTSDTIRSPPPPREAVCLNSNLTLNTILRCLTIAYNEGNVGGLDDKTKKMSL